MTTLSQLVDEMVVELVRPDLRAAMVDAAVTSIRELHVHPRTTKVILFMANRNEDEEVTLAAPFLWPIPSVPRFQRLESAYYVNRGIWVREKALQIQSNQETYDPNRDAFWYRGGSNVAFSGCAVGETVKLSWFEYPRRLIYYPKGHATIVRPCEYDPETESFTYATSYDVTDETRENARNLCTHWVLLRWDMVIKQGVRAKIWARLGEMERSKLAYSTYTSLMAQIHESEETVEGGMS